MIDSSKAIGYGVANEGDVWDFYDGREVHRLSSNWSNSYDLRQQEIEIIDSSVITNEDGWLKRGYSNNHCRCKLQS